MVNLIPKRGGLCSAKEFAHQFPSSPLTVIEGDDPVLQSLTPNGKYYLIQLQPPGNTRILGYEAPPSARRETLPRLDPLPFQTRKAAEEEVMRIRQAQAAWLEIEAANLREEEEKRARTCTITPQLFTKSLLGE